MGTTKVSLSFVCYDTVDGGTRRARASNEWKVNKSTPVAINYHGILVSYMPSQ